MQTKLATPNSVILYQNGAVFTTGTQSLNEISNDPDSNYLQSGPGKSLFYPDEVLISFLYRALSTPDGGFGLNVLTPSCVVFVLVTLLAKEILNGIVFNRAGPVGYWPVCAADLFY